MHIIFNSCLSCKEEVNDKLHRAIGRLVLSLHYFLNAVATSEHYFICPSLQDHEIVGLKTLALHNSMDLVSSMSKAQVQGAQRQQDWMLCADEKDVKIYRAEDKVHVSTHGTMYMYAGTTQVVGTVDEFVALFKNETTIEAKEYCRRFANRLMDSVVLYSLVKPSEEQPHERIGINWRAFESWGGKLFQNRDSCLLECHHEFYVGSRRGWVCSLISVDLECCPSLEDTLGLVRQCDYGSGHVVLESNRRGYLDVTYITHTNVGVGKSEWIYNSLGQIPRLAEISLKSRVRHVSKIDRFLPIKSHSVLGHRRAHASRCRCILLFVQQKV
ncbi:hypothetical protein AC1031_005630 [Aphanomyces cochlioides]|nr:hypothetical protein AC1031_005630 [Aphanomyces cochlioides]